MRVIAIDPGYDRLGVSVMELNDNKEVLLHSACLLTDKNCAVADRIFFIGQSFLHLVEQYKPDTLAIETLFFNKNQKTALGVAETRGVLIYLAKTHNLSVYEFNPQEIKIAVTGYGKSDKTAVIDMVKRLIVSAPPKALDDEYDAIAVGITCLAQHGRSQ